MPVIDIDRMVFVFGSNEAGRHGAGAARYAANCRGAIMGEGIGHFGDSYALPTKDRQILTLPLMAINSYVKSFLEYARKHPEMDFQVTRVGCGLAGLTDEQMAPMFADAGHNCHLPGVWDNILSKTFSALSTSTFQRIAVFDPQDKQLPEALFMSTVGQWGDLGKPDTPSVLLVKDPEPFENLLPTFNALAWGSSHYLPSNNKLFEKTMADCGLERYNQGMSNALRGPSC